MNGGHACRTIEETKSSGFHVDVRRLCEAAGAPSEPPPSSGRSEDPTLAYTDPYADTLEAHGGFAGAHPHWCVDAGDALLTMTTFELWEALERGQVLAWMRVWREGMECWMPIGEIAEFTWALAGTPPPPSEPAMIPDSPSGLGEGPPPTPETADTPPESAERPVAFPRPWARPAARWIALGSAVALLAVVSAIAVSSEPARGAPAETPGAARGEPVEAALAPPPPAEERLGSQAAMRHGERGQRRQPRDGRRAYGR